MSENGEGYKPSVKETMISIPVIDLGDKKLIKAEDVNKAVADVDSNQGGKIIEGVFNNPVGNETVQADSTNEEKKSEVNKPWYKKAANWIVEDLKLIPHELEYTPEELEKHLNNQAKKQAQKSGDPTTVEGSNLTYVPFGGKDKK
jgi:hypothetical protein